MRVRTHGHVCTPGYLRIPGYRCTRGYLCTHGHQRTHGCRRTLGSKHLQPLHAAAHHLGVLQVWGGPHAAARDLDRARGPEDRTGGAMSKAHPTDSPDRAGVLCCDANPNTPCGYRLSSAGMVEWKAYSVVTLGIHRCIFYAPPPSCSSCGTRFQFDRSYGITRPPQ